MMTAVPFSITTPIDPIESAEFLGTAAAAEIVAKTA